MFYLKYAKATDVTATLGQIMAGAAASTPAAAESRRRRRRKPHGRHVRRTFGRLADDSAAAGAADGAQSKQRRRLSDGASTTTATVNPSAGRTGLATGPVKITADQRLNALLVRANRADLDTIEELLKVLDQKESPEDISVATRPRMIAVENSSAQEIADIVKQVYADRMVENPNPNRRGAFFTMMARAGNQGTVNRKTTSPNCRSASIREPTR